MVQPVAEAYAEATSGNDVARGSTDDGETRGSARMIAVRIVSTLVVATLVMLAVRKMDIAALRGALASAAVAPLVLASLLSFTMLLAKARYWKTIVSPVATVPVRTMLWFEKVSDVTSLVLLVLPMPWLFPKETWLGRLQVIAAVVLVAIVVAFFLAQRARRSFAWVARLRIFDTPRTTLTAYACVLTSWIADATLILVVMHAIGLPMQVGAALLVLLAANVAIAIPTAPGNVGALELGVAFALTRLGVPGERAAAFAILYHGIQLATLVAVWSIGAGFNALSATRARTFRRA